MKATAYQIIRLSDEEVLDEGIVSDSESTIYPAQNEPYLVEEFPDMPYECELHHFQVTGCAIRTVQFDITWEQANEHKMRNRW